MAEFKKLSEVEQIETASDNATVLIEEGGEIKRVPKKEVGGAGIATAIIKDSDYDNTLAGIQTMESMELTYECINMTFEEAYQIMTSGEPLDVFGMLSSEGICGNSHCLMAILLDASVGVPCILVVLNSPDSNIELYWTADGLSTSEPNSDGR